MRATRLIPLLLFVGAVHLHAHAIHQSRAEADYNPKSKMLEVSLTVFVNDLEVALIRQAERELSLAKSAPADVDAEILRFLEQHFIVTDKTGNTVPIAWVGRQIDASTEASGDPAVTLYFELPLPDGIKGTTLKHTVFCDHFADQLNLVHLRSGTQNTELRFTKGAAMKPLPPLN